MQAQGTDSGAQQSICVRVPNWVGDVVMATPAFRALRRHFSTGRIVAVIHERVERVVWGSGWFDHTIVCRRASTGWAGGFWRCLKELRSSGCELALLMPNSFSSALMAALAGVPRRVGYVRDVRRILLTDAIPRPTKEGNFTPTYMVDYYLKLCAQAGVPAAGRETELCFSAADVARTEGILEGAGVDLSKPLFLLHPGAGFGPSKRWPEEHFAALAARLVRELGGGAALIGGPSEKATAARIAEFCPVAVHDLIGVGIDLHLLKCVVARSRLLVTTDSGPRHYGVALGVPTVCLMGPTAPGYSTSGRAHDHVVRLDVECGPCQRKICRRDHRCMVGITPQMVFSRCTAALGGDR